jgi:hypothetical protein
MLPPFQTPEASPIPSSVPDDGGDDDEDWCDDDGDDNDMPTPEWPILPTVSINSSSDIHALMTHSPVSDHRRFLLSHAYSICASRKLGSRNLPDPPEPRRNCNPALDVPFDCRWIGAWRWNARCYVSRDLSHRFESATSFSLLLVPLVTTPRDKTG